MKQTAEKKPKVFRTLIRQVHTGNKEIQKDNKVQAAERRSERIKHPSFSACNDALCLNAGSFYERDGDTIPYSAIHLIGE